jgi:DNA-directed RNA polymerase subunit RPC12/RpoP
MSIGPRADFTCLSPKCRQDEGATVYEDLPTATTRCPVCGSKRIMRLYNKVNVIGTRSLQPEFDPRLTSSSPAVVKNALMQPGFDRAEAHRSTGSDPTKPGGRLRSWAIPYVAMADPTYQNKTGQGRPMRELERAALRRYDPQPQNISVILDAIARKPIPSTVAGR